jgi:hypothetical protein
MREFEERTARLDETRNILRTLVAIAAKKAA